MKVCSNCHQEVNPNFKICPYCGKPLSIEEEKPVESVSKDDDFSSDLDAFLGGNITKNTSKTPLNSEKPAPKPVINESDKLDSFMGVSETIAKRKRIYRDLLLRGRMFCIRKNFAEATKIYNKLIDLNPSDVNGFIGLVRVASANYTIFEGPRIDDAIRQVNEISGLKSFETVDSEYAEFLNKRKEFFIKKERQEAERAKKEKIEAEKKAQLEKEKREREEAEKKEKEARIAAEKAKKAAEEAARKLEEEKKVAAAKEKEKAKKAAQDLEHRKKVIQLAEEKKAKLEKEKEEAAKAKVEFEGYLLKAENGDIEACYQVGLHYWNGIGTEKNGSLAITYLLKAIDGKHAKAAESLGDVYSSFYYREYKKAIGYYKLAIKLNKKNNHKELNYSIVSKINEAKKRK